MVSNDEAFQPLSLIDIIGNPILDLGFVFHFWKCCQLWDLSVISAFFALIPDMTCLWDLYFLCSCYEQLCSQPRLIF